jgi:hypothetical protein
MKRLCPHCHADLPDDATFCGACGRRIEGWSKAPLAADLGAGEPSAPTDGGEMPTRQMDVTPEMLRKARPSDERAAARAAAGGAPAPQPTKPSSKNNRPVKAAPTPAPAAAADDESPSAMMRAVKRPRAPLLIGLGVLGVGAAAGAFVLVRHTVGGGSGAPPPVAPSPAVATPDPAAPPVAAAPAPASKSGKRRRAVRLTPIEGSSADTGRKPPSTPSARPVVDNGKGGALPKKTVATDSKPLPSGAPPPAAPAAPPAHPSPKAPIDPYAGPPPEDLPSEATPMTEEEMKSQAEAQIDADSVRYVVKSHLSQVRSCYSRAFKDSSPGGRVDLAFAIDRNGRAVRVRTDANTTDSESLSRCLEERVKEWQFPRPVGGEIELVYPFIFAAGS